LSALGEIVNSLNWAIFLFPQLESLVDTIVMRSGWSNSRAMFGIRRGLPIEERDMEHAHISLQNRAGWNQRRPVFCGYILLFGQIKQMDVLAYIRCKRMDKIRKVSKWDDLSTSVLMSFFNFVKSYYFYYNSTIYPSQF